MVAITRSVAARQHQSLISENVALSTGAGVTKRKGKKKKESAEQCATSITPVISTQPIITENTTPSTSGIFKLLRFLSKYLNMFR